MSPDVVDGGAVRIVLPVRTQLLWFVSLDSAPLFRSRMHEAFQRGSIYSLYARPRDYYAALFAPNTLLDDESCTAARCTVALTQGFLLRLCHLQLPLWLVGRCPSCVLALMSCMHG